MSKPEQLRSIRESENRITMLSFPAKTLPHSIQMIFHKYDYSKYAASAIIQNQIPLRPVASNPNLGFVPQKNSVQQKSTGSLELPFPRTLRDATGVQVTSFERDFLYERLASGVASLSNMSGDDILAGLGGVIGAGLAGVREGGAAVVRDGPAAAVAAAMQKLFANVGSDTAKSVATFLAKKYLPGDLAKTVSAVAGQVVNPQQTLAFEGVNLREFTFEWDLFPSNLEDTKQITNIVNFLKRQMLPGTSGIANVSGLEKAFLQYPSVVELSLLGVQEAHFMRFKRAMIDNVSVDYTGGGNQVSIIKGGVPASVTLSISFKELTIQTAEDYGAAPIEPITVVPNETTFDSLVDAQSRAFGAGLLRGLT